MYTHHINLISLWYNIYMTIKEVIMQYNGKKIDLTIYRDGDVIKSIQYNKKGEVIKEYNHGAGKTIPKVFKRLKELYGEG